MRTRFDGLAKDALSATLGIAARVDLQHGVSAEMQYFDVVCDPDPARAGERDRLGLLGRMTDELCALEPYHEPPDEEELTGNLRKQLTWQHVLTKQARAADSAARMVRLPLQWVLAGGRPTSALDHFEMAPLDGWPAGVYTAVSWARLRLVVLSELPRTPDTLLLRLLGAGVTLRTAMAELIALPPDTWVRKLLVPLFLKFRFKLPQDPAQRTPEEEAFIMTAEDYIEAIRDEGRRKGRDAGLREGRDAGLREGRDAGLREGREALVVHQVERRLKRPLSQGERAALHARVLTLGAEQVSDLAADLDAESLAAWLGEAAQSGGA